MFYILKTSAKKSKVKVTLCQSVPYLSLFHSLVVSLSGRVYTTFGLKNKRFGLKNK